MSKILIEFDTETKNANASIDGVAVENLSSVSIYHDCCDAYAGQKFCCSITSSSRDEVKKVSHISTVYASEKKTAREEIRDWFLGKKDLK